MKRFEMVTEADARSLEYGSTILLRDGGHITPLAADTLRARRISVEREGTDPEVAGLAPAADVRTVAIAGDHTSLAMKIAIVQHLRARGLTAHDLGTQTSEPVDYPDTAAAAALPHIANVTMPGPKRSARPVRPATRNVFCST